MQREFDVVIERDTKGYYVASVPALRGCHTQARSLDALMERVREAIELCLDVEEEDTEPLDFVGVQRISVAAWAGCRAHRERNWFGRLAKLASR
ncbi:hypothetical protein BH23GEM4_BH23GEM4_20630 [soil metagenome]